MAAKGNVTAAGKRIPLLEWISAAVGLLIVLVIVVLLGVEGLKSKKDELPPLLLVEANSFSAYSDSYIVEVTVRNRSRQTGASVQLEGSLSEGETEVETSSTVLGYVPGKSQRRAGLVFTKDPRRYKLELRVSGYERP